MTVLFAVLSVIGHILLILLAVVILLILLLLFWPVKYQADGKINETCNIRFKLWWLFHIFGLTVVVKENKPYVWFYFLKKKKVLYSSSEGSAKSAGKNKKRSQKKQKNAEVNRPSEENTPQETSLKEMIKAEEVNTKIMDIPQKDQKSSGKAQTETSVDDQQRQKETDKVHKKKKNIFQAIKEKWIAFYEKFKAAKDKVQQLKDIWNNEEYQKLIKLILKKLKYLGRHIKPRMIRTRLNYSLEDPCLTGKVTAMISMIPLIYIYDFGIYPDFESDEMYIKGTFHVKGHIRLIHIAVVAIGLLLNKNFRKLIKKLREK